MRGGDGGCVSGMVWGTTDCLRDALAQVVHMTVVAGITHSRREVVLTPETGVSGGGNSLGNWDFTWCSCWCALF